MQALARALTTSADPAQVADAVFGALRDELSVDAAAFATTNERGVLCVHRRFGYQESEAEGALVAAMEPDGELAEVLAQRQGFFADSIDEQRGERPLITASVEASRFSSYAVVPLVVSDHAVGAVVVQWVKPRSITEARQAVPLHHHRSGGPGRRAGPLDAHRIPQSRAQPAPARPQLGPGRGHDAERSGPRGHRERASCPWRAVGGLPRPRSRGARRSRAWPAAGTPPCLSCGVIPVDHTPSGATFTSGRTVTTSLGAPVHLDDRRVARDRARTSWRSWVIRSPS